MIGNLLDATLEACAGLVALAIVLVVVVPPLALVGLVAYGCKTLRNICHEG